MLTDQDKLNVGFDSRSVGYVIINLHTQTQELSHHHSLGGGTVATLLFILWSAYKYCSSSQVAAGVTGEQVQKTIKNTLSTHHRI